MESYVGHENQQISHHYNLEMHHHRWFIACQQKWYFWMSGGQCENFSSCTVPFFTAATT